MTAEEMAGRVYRSEPVVERQQHHGKRSTQNDHIKDRPEDDEGNHRKKQYR